MVFLRGNMESMRVILVRHGQVQQPGKATFYGGADVPLSAAGEAEARRAGSFLQGLKLDHIACSPLSRARYGANQVAESQSPAFGQPELVDGFREIDRGRWFGLTREELSQQWPGDWEAHQNDLEAWRDHGGESIGGLRDRVLCGLEELRGRWSGKTVCIVSHLFPTRAILAFGAGAGLEAWDSLVIPTASISVLEFLPSGSCRVGLIGKVPREGEVASEASLFSLLRETT